MSSYKNQDVKLEILEALVDFVEKNRSLPTLTELKKWDSVVTNKRVEYHFGNLGNLIKEGKKTAKDTFSKIFSEEDFLKHEPEKVKKALKKHNRVIITSAICGSKVDLDILKSIKNMAKRKKAAIFVIPVKYKKSGFIKLDNVLKDKDICIVTEETFLNTNIKVIPVNLNAKAVRPHSGFTRIGKRSCSIIMGAPKLSKESVPTANDKMPHQIITTGVITDANYINGLEVAKTDYIASEDHKKAAVIVEIASKDIYFQREVEFDVDGSFIDVGLNGAIRYLPNGKTKKEEAEGFSIGDSHFPYENDPIADSIFRQVNRTLKAKNTFLHDVYSFSGRSHHDDHNEVLMIKKAESGKLNLLDELNKTRVNIDAWIRDSKKVHIVPSNHNEHLDRYINEGRHRKDPHNARVVLSMILESLNGVQPLEHGLRHFTDLNSNKIIFHKRDSSFKIQGTEMLFHGDKGGDGARGSINNLSIALGNCVIGHSHKAGISGDTWQNGTSTYIDVENRPGYASGAPSSWLQTSTALFRGKGDKCLRTQITVIDEAWCLEDWLKKNRNKTKKKAA